MNEVVITGSRGFLGQHLVAALRRDRIEVVGTGQEPRWGPHGSRYHRLVPGVAQTLRNLDLEGRPFTLIHLAWDTSRPPCYANHVDNVRFLAELLDYWTPLSLEAVLMPGTAEEYAQRGGHLKENDPPLGPLTGYGWGKRAAAELLRNWSAATGKPALWLRPFIVYGPGQSGKMAIPYAIHQALGRRPAEFSDGLQQRDFIHVDDVVEAFRIALTWTTPGFWPINLGTGLPVTLREVLEHIADQFAAHELFRFGAIPRRPHEPLIQVADATLAQDQLGWRARTGWREGIGRLCAALPEPWLREAG